MAIEMGKPLRDGRGEIDKCAAACEFFAARAAGFLADEPIESSARKSYVRCEPLGPVLAIMPWNFPFWQVIRFAAPGLMAGNVAVLKHAPNVPGCADALEAAFAEAGFPVGVFTSLRVIDNAAAERLVSHPAIAAVTLTGSTRAGAAVAAAAGRAIKKTVLELGGSDAFIVLRDADVAVAAKAAAAARCVNGGQSCIAAKRFIVDEPIAAEFEKALAAEMGRLKIGDPLEESTEIGPLARADLRDSLHDQVRRSLAAGARLLLGGSPRAGVGFYYEPTVLADVAPGMAAFDEETFGPVAAVVRAKGADDAVRLANASDYGLGASVWTRDIALAESMAGRIEAGSVFINGPVVSEARLPFGGTRQSGYGRELSGFGIREFVNVKTICLGKSAR
jgi:succinate-semialdehyde dehydrogenase/glutarate-semialdehyde dehydrogenase